MNTDTRPIYLIACTKTKAATACKARDMYAPSDWFAKARAYVEALGADWLILSAEHGLLDTDTVIEPYETSLTKMDAGHRLTWANDTWGQLVDAGLTTRPVVFLAGALYRATLTTWLHDLAGQTASVPMAGLGLGQQKAWLVAERDRVIAARAIMHRADGGAVDPAPVPVRVYHRDNAGFELVATVTAPAQLAADAEALEYAWRWTNNVEGSWSRGYVLDGGQDNGDFNAATTVEGPLHVLANGELMGLRSSMVGDVFVSPAGAFVAASFGFEPFEADTASDAATWEPPRTALAILRVLADRDVSSEAFCAALEDARQLVARS